MSHSCHKESLNNLLEHIWHRKIEKKNNAKKVLDIIFQLRNLDSNIHIRKYNEILASWLQLLAWK